MYFHRTVHRTATVWRRCSVDVDIVVDRWHCRPDVEGGVHFLGQICIKKEPKKKNGNFFFKQTSLIRLNTVYGRFYVRVKRCVVKKLKEHNFMNIILLCSNNRCKKVVLLL